jgi:histidinol phosphatase-like enzyme
MLLRAAEQHGINMNHSIMIGGKESDLQAASKAGGDLRFHCLANTYRSTTSNAAMHKIYSLRRAISLLNQSVAT